MFKPTPPHVVRKMREMRARGDKRTEIARALGVSISTVHRLTRGLSPSVSRSTNLPKGASGLNPEDPERDEAVVADLICSGSLRKTGKRHGIAHERVRQIVAGWQKRTGETIPR